MGTSLLEGNNEIRNTLAQAITRIERLIVLSDEILVNRKENIDLGEEGNLREIFKEQTITIQMQDNKEVEVPYHHLYNQSGIPLFDNTNIWKGRFMLRLRLIDQTGDGLIASCAPLGALYITDPWTRVCNESIFTNV